MRRIALLIFAVFFLLYGIQSHACVGRILNIGIVDTLNENLLAELVSVLINERTGTTVNVKVFNSREEIYNAVKREKIGIVVENTDNALKMLNIPGSGDMKKDYDVSKREFRERKNLVWLKPFGSMPDNNNLKYYSAVISEDVLINFPALPRVINKLKYITGDRGFDKVIKSVRSGKKTRRAAKDFLKKKKLI
jgi:glycine betaine/choline ABC-type transport system substrate-binding protein